MNFNNLIDNISYTHNTLLKYARKTIDQCLTLRNCLIGYYIQEYELNGNDRAVYGLHLLENLAKKLSQKTVTGCSYRNLNIFRKFYQYYPQILQTLSAESLFLPKSITYPILQTVSAESLKVSDKQKKIIAPQTLLLSLSFSHFVELINIDDHLKRIFYEQECINCGWSVRELRRQIASLYYERMGLSKNKKGHLSLVRNRTKNVTDINTEIRDPYIFEFLGLKPKEIMHENDLRDALLDKLQDFMLELGRGFCFEARNKRILIGEEYFFIDLVFYHKILKCNVLFEIKIGAFSHENIGQLNTYLNYYKKHEMSEGDNPPIGILLCTEKNHALVEYALAGINGKLFVSKYKLALPTKREIKELIEGELKNK
jgi:predicted nuclease of restriction endonuclease-like (RecB) superfamily